MDWLDWVQIRLQKKNQILFSKDDPFLSDFNLLLKKQSHQVVVLWALDLAEQAVVSLEKKYQQEYRPRNALETSRLWAAGKVKMHQAQHEILRCHAMAKEISNLADIATCHAIGQACATVHTTGHAIGFPMYDLTSIVRTYGIENCRTPVETTMQTYLDKLYYWQSQPLTRYEWAEFMKR